MAKRNNNLNNGGNISGRNRATLTLSNVVAGDAGSYNCVVSGSCAPAVTSNNATLTVSAGASISGQPAGDIKCPGGNTSFSVTATGAGLTYQRRKGTTNLNNGGNISGATTTTLTLANLTITDGGSYNCVVSSACGSPATTSNATLTINALPSISTHPANDTKCPGIQRKLRGHCKWNGPHLSMEKGHDQSQQWRNYLRRYVQHIVDQQYYSRRCGNL